MRRHPAREGALLVAVLLAASTDQSPAPPAAPPYPFSTTAHCRTSACSFALLTLCCLPPCVCYFRSSRTPGFARLHHPHPLQYCTVSLCGCVILLTPPAWPCASARACSARTRHVPFDCSSRFPARCCCFLSFNRYAKHWNQPVRTQEADSVRPAALRTPPQAMHVLPKHHTPSPAYALHLHFFHTQA